MALSNVRRTPSGDHVLTWSFQGKHEIISELYKLFMVITMLDQKLYLKVRIANVVERTIRVESLF